MSKGFSYKEMLNNALIIFINRRINESKDMQEKFNSLDEKKQQSLHKKIIDFTISKAKSIHETQGLGYVGVEDDTVISWIDDFFDDFEENTKEPEKPKIEPRTVSTSTLGSNKKEYDTEEGFFGLEVKIDKKKTLSKEDFITKIKEENKGKEVGFEWLDGKVKITIKDKKTKEEKHKEKETKKEEIPLKTTEDQEEDDGDFEEEDEVLEKEELEKETPLKTEDQEDEDEEYEEEDEDQEDEDEEYEEEDDEEEEDDFL